MKVLIIGGTGFLSSAIVREAIRRGHEVTIVTRGSASRATPAAGVSVLHADRSDAAALREAVAGQEFDIVIDSILFKPEDARAAVEIFGGQVSSYVFISTDFVYGGEPRSFPIKENAPRNAAGDYGRNKAAAEDALFAAHAHLAFPVVVLRPPHIVGAGSLIGTGSREGRDLHILARLRERRPLFLLDDGLLIIQPIHRDDIARACFAVAASDNTKGNSYNIAGPDAVSTRRYYEIVCELIGLNPDNMNTYSLPSSAYLTAFPDRGSFAQNRHYSTERLRRDTGLAPTVRLRDALAEMIAELETRDIPAEEPSPEDAILVALLLAHQEAIADRLRPKTGA